MWTQGLLMKLIRGVIKTVLRKRCRERLALAGTRPQPRGNDPAARVVCSRHNTPNKRNSDRMDTHYVVLFKFSIHYA